MKTKILILIFIGSISYFYARGQVITGEKKSIRITTNKDVDT
ncbi:unnamed protein product, partial [marine sediment metagenome]